MDNSPKDVYGRALAEAKTELAKLDHDYEKISKRKAQLEAFIANTEPLVPATARIKIAIAPLPVAKRVLPTQPIWKSIALSINGKSASFTVRDALDGLARIGRPIESPNRMQIVRNVLMKKTANFEQIGAGLFKLKKAIEKEAT